MSPFSLKILGPIRIFLIPLDELLPLTLKFFSNSLSLLLNVPVDSELDNDTIRFLYRHLCGILKHSVDVVVSLLEGLDSGNVLVTDHLSDSLAVDPDAVSECVEQVLSACLVGRLSVSRERVHSLLVIREDSTEAFSDATEELLTLSLNGLLRGLDISAFA